MWSNTKNNGFKQSSVNPQIVPNYPNQYCHPHLRLQTVYESVNNNYASSTAPTQQTSYEGNNGFEDFTYSDCKI